MSEAAQKVVVIQDASKEISSSALEWAFMGLKLKPGDELILLAVLHQVNTPSTFPFMGARALMGYKTRIDTSSIFGVNHKIIKEAVQKKKEEYQNNIELLHIHELSESNKINFSVLVAPASSPKTVAMEATRNLKATWVILDRQMKKDKKYFLEKLSCGISRLKRDNSVEKLRGPKAPGANNIKRDGSRSSLVTYDEMLPGIPDDEDLFSLEVAPKYTKGPNKNSETGENSRTDGEKENPKSPLLPNSVSSEQISSDQTVSSPNKINIENSLVPSSHEVKNSPLRTQEEENQIENVSPSVISNSWNQIEDTEEANQIVGTTPERNVDDQECFTLELEEWQTEETLESSVCPDCGNRRPNTRWSRSFTYSELKAATENFSKENFLSEGGFGSVYKGTLTGGQQIAVKQHKHASLQGEREFNREVHVLSKARHKHVVMLLGSCSEGNHSLLVYEFVCNGSLDQHLSKRNPKVLSWSDRLKIALGAAKGLQYLHNNNIIHRDMRPNNILVTHDYEPLLGDFGLARTQHDDSDHSSETRVVGTIGYLAPEYAESGKVSRKTDVYSFGVVLLELITGRRTINRAQKEKSLVGWARPLLKERRYPDLIDPRILDSHDVHQLFWMVRVTEKCLSKDPDKRLSMDKVVYVLKCIMEGKTVIGIEDFSPTRTDFVPSKWNMDEAEGGNEIVPWERLSISTEESLTSRTSLNDLFQSTSSSSKSFSRSSSTTASSESSTSGSRKGSKKKRGKSGTQVQVLYGEMLS